MRTARAASVSEALPEGLHLRTPTGEDHPRVLAVLDKWWGHFGGEGGSQQRSQLLPRLFFEHFTDTSALLEFPDRRPAAFLIGFLSPSHPDTAYIHFVGVDPALQRIGVGAWLYERFFTAARDRGAHVVRCVTSPGNSASIAFHTARGFQVEPGDALIDGVPVKRDYDGPGLHRVTFTRRLGRIQPP